MWWGGVVGAGVRKLLARYFTYIHERLAAHSMASHPTKCYTDIADYRKRHLTDVNVNAEQCVSTEIDDDSQADDDKPKLHLLRRMPCLQTDPKGTKDRHQNGSSFQAMHDAWLCSQYHKDLKNMGSRATESGQLLRCRI